MNCIIIDDDEFIIKIIEEFVRKTDTLNLVRSMTSAIEAINLLGSGEKIDLIFLDIEMPEMSGLEFLSSLTVYPQIIIISNKDKYAINAFDFDVTDYLVKPLTYSRFSKAIGKALSRKKIKEQTAVGSEQTIVDNNIFIKQGTSLLKIKFSEILWIEAMENYIVINTFNQKYTVHFTMRAIEQKLPPKHFLRVHRSFIVNINEVHSIEEKTINIVTKNSEINTVPIGKVYRNNLLKKINLMTRE